MRVYIFNSAEVGDNMLMRQYNCREGFVLRSCEVLPGVYIVQRISRVQAAREIGMLRTAGCTMNVSRSYCAAN